MGAAVVAYERGASLFARTTSAEHVEALTAAAAVAVPRTVVVELAASKCRAGTGSKRTSGRASSRSSTTSASSSPEPKADRIEDTVDYRDVVELLREISEAREFSLLEALAGAVAEALLRRFPSIRHVRVRVRKPRVQLGTAVDYAAATVERWRGPDL